MAFKMLLLAVVLGCANAAYEHRPQSAASLSQIAYAMSQNYDQTGPGAHLPLVQQETSTTTQALQQQQAFPQQQFNQQQVYHRQEFAVQQQYANQPQAYGNLAHAFNSQQQAYAPTPQVHSGQQHSQLNYAQPQVAFSHASPSYVQVAQPSQLSYSQASHPQSAPVSYSDTPQIVYSSSPHAAFPAQSAHLLTASPPKGIQPESYNANPQYTFSYNTQHQGAPGNSNEQEEIPREAYTLVGAEGPREHNAYRPLHQSQPPPEKYIGGPQRQTYLTAVGPVHSSPIMQQFYAPPTASKNVYPAAAGSQNSLLSGPKNLYSSYLSQK